MVRGWEVGNSLRNNRKKKYSLRNLWSKTVFLTRQGKLKRRDEVRYSEFSLGVAKTDTQDRVWMFERRLHL